jgi:tRNA-specific 2-thiouridylase
VSAYLLKKQGYKVVGAFIKVWEPDWLPCTSGADRLDAMRVAAHLGIPFKTYDLAEEYKKEVVDYFVEEYRQGRTPNPDVTCNRAIKFGAFWERAQADGADMVATGHYARNENGMLLRGVDDSKDQSYFLWTLTQDDLTHALFPVGRMPKSEVRAIAAKARLPNAAKRDSQGLCFLGHVDMKEFLMRVLPAEPGDVRLYTVGERVSGQYVIAKNIQNNELTLAPQLLDVGRQAVRLSGVNWIREVPDASKIYEIQVRYHGEKIPAHVDGNKVTFEKPVLAAPGQSLVVYDPRPTESFGQASTDECMGGGIIA